MKQFRMMAALLALSTLSALAQLPPSAEVAVTAPSNAAVFPTGTTNIQFNWTAATDLGVSSYELNIIRNGRPYVLQTGILENAYALTRSFTPAHYAVTVRSIFGLSSGVNESILTPYAAKLMVYYWDGIHGPWSAPVSFTVLRAMDPDGGVVTNRSPKAFRWTRSDPATRYLLKIAQFDKSRGNYVQKRSTWMPQRETGDGLWKLPYRLPDGKFRWTVTDYKGEKKGYTQAGYFRIANSGHTSWNDPKLLIGTWKVVTDWRWREMTFQSDGFIKNVQGDGTAFTRATWSANDTTLTMVSDVVEKCPYTVTPTTLTFTLPSGNVKILTRVR